MAVEDFHTSQLGTAQLGLIQLGMVSSEPAPAPPVVVPSMDSWFVQLAFPEPIITEVISY